VGIHCLPFSHKKKSTYPYAYKTMRDDAEEAGLDEKTLTMFDKLAGK